jgi:heme exporter protein A
MLTASGLTCLRGDRTVLRDISFALEPGRALIVRGANGAGKSTLLRVLAGLLRPASGAIAHDGCNMNDDTVAYKRKLCWLGHQDALKPSETVEQSVWFRSRLHGGHDIGPSLLAFDLGALRHSPARELSTGQKRRVALAGVISSRAPLWLLDEPTASLDAASSALFEIALGQHLEAGGMAVIATHDALGPSHSQELHL